MSNRIVLNETSYHGAGAIKEISGEVKRRGLKKAFVCSDPDLVKFKVTDKVLDVLQENNLDYELYSDIKPNPTIENVQTGVAACLKQENKFYAKNTSYASVVRTVIIVGVLKIYHLPTNI